MDPRICLGALLELRLWSRRVDLDRHPTKMEGPKSIGRRAGRKEKAHWEGEASFARISTEIPPDRPADGPIAVQVLQMREYIVAMHEAYWQMQHQQASYSNIRKTTGSFTSTEKFKRKRSKPVKELRSATETPETSSGFDQDCCNKILWHSEVWKTAVDCQNKYVLAWKRAMDSFILCFNAKTTIRNRIFLILFARISTSVFLVMFHFLFITTTCSSSSLLFLQLQISTNGKLRRTVASGHQRECFSSKEA